MHHFGLAISGGLKPAIAQLAQLTPKQFLAIVEAVQVERDLDDVARHGVMRSKAEADMVANLEKVRQRGAKRDANQDARFTDFIVRQLAGMKLQEFGAVQ